MNWIVQYLNYQKVFGYAQVNFKAQKKSKQKQDYWGKRTGEKKIKPFDEVYLWIQIVQ